MPDIIQLKDVADAIKNNTKKLEAIATKKEIEKNFGDQAKNISKIIAELTKQSDKLTKLATEEKIDERFREQAQSIADILKKLGEQANKLSDLVTEEKIDEKFGAQAQSIADILKKLGEQAQTLGKIATTELINNKFNDQAKTISSILTQLGSQSGKLDEIEKKRMVCGEVRRENGVAFKCGLVRAFHETERKGAIRLGEDTTDKEGRYTIRYAPLPDVDGINLYVVVFDANGNPISKSGVIRKAKPLEIWNLTVPTVDGAKFQVEGKVSSRVNAGIGGLQVRIVDKTAGDDVQLAEATTDERGTYRASFTDAEPLKRGKEQIDLQARVYAGKKFLAASDVRYNASIRETLNVLLDEKTTSSLRSEHETLTISLANHFKGKLGDLKETDERQDITYLANKTGWDARAVALAALADQFSTRTMERGGAGIEPAFFYALFRAGLPANENALYQTDVKTAEAIWKQAISQGVIPASLENGLPGAVDEFQKLVAQRALEGPTFVGVSPLKDMLSVSLGDNPQKQNRFAEIYAQHRGDLPKFWGAVKAEFGEKAEKRLKLDGQLAYLTMNNAPLISKLHKAAGQNGVSDPISLVEKGYYRMEKWQAQMGNDPIPPAIPGKNDAEKRARYAELLAAQVRLSYPTAVMAQMVKDGDTPLEANALKNQVHAFLKEHQDKFEIGMQPVEQYIVRNKLQIDPKVIKEITRIQRVYQITPSDEAMNVLLKKKVDSAYAVVRYDRDEFVRAFKNDVGGEVNARLIHAKAQQVHNAVLNIAVSYLTASNAPGIGIHSSAQVLDPTPNVPAHAGDIIAYSTLESLFGELDYCACGHCRSILSPAAYLVDLLLFCDRQVNEKENPLKVLLERRPDIQHLPLTCENTNMPLPYIDLVNETLEYYVTNNLSLSGYTGHTTDDRVTPEELLANPQFVSDKAFETLAGKPAHAGGPLPLLPPVLPLPFHQPLETLRRYFDKFKAPLSKVMEALRENDNLERPNPADPSHPLEYGFRDILMEELHLSRTEYAHLTNRTLTLQQLYGYPPATSDADVLSDLSNAKVFTRRVGISYEDIIEILKTRFVNPYSTLIPRLERLGVSFATLKKLKDSPAGSPFDTQFDALLSPALDLSQYNGNVKIWVRNQQNYERIMSLITLTDPDSPDDICSFDKLEFRYSNPDKLNNPIRAFEFVRLIRFIRLWKKMGWTIEQTDKAVTALYPTDQTPDHPSEAENLKRLDKGFLVLLPRLGIIKRVLEALKLKPKKDLLPLLACFAPIDTHDGMEWFVDQDKSHSHRTTPSLYRQMFPATLRKQVPVFEDNGYGEFLTDNTQKLTAHAETLRAAFLLTDDELGQITSALGYNNNTVLNLDNISAIFRRGWLGRKLKLSAQEFLLLTHFSNIDPFAPPDPPDPPILRLIELVNRLRAESLKPTQALYLIWNQDISGKSSPDDGEIADFARVLRSDLTAIESEFVYSDDPDGQIARTRMAIVYGNDTTNLFFGLLDNTLITDVSYSHSQITLEQLILDTARGRIGYDDFRKRLSYSGVLTTATRDALKAVVGVTPQFRNAVTNLYVENQKIVGPFFDRYPELKPLYDAFVFFGELKVIVGYVHAQNSLDQAILDIAPGRITYDHARNEMSFKGVMTITTRDSLKAVAGVTAQFQTAVDNLFTSNQAAIQDFFNSYPTLASYKEAYLAANDAIGERRSVLLATFLPELKRRRKRQQALQAASAAARTDVEFASALLEASTVLHAAVDNTRPALDDLTALETPGLSVQFFFRNTATGRVDQSRDAEADLAYAASGSNRLPANPAPGNAISGIWSGYLEVPENGFYNIRIETDAGHPVTLTLGGEDVVLAQNGNIWSNNVPIELRAARLYAISLIVEKVKDTLKVQWQTMGRGWEIIPSPYLYSATLADHLQRAYVRFLKAVSLAATLKLTAAETGYFASHLDYQIVGGGWLNSLPVVGSPDNAIWSGLRKAFYALLDFSRVKAGLSPDDERLLTVLRDPAAAAQTPESLLFTLTRWEPNSLDSLLTRFGMINDGNADRDALKDLSTFCRIYDAYAWVKALRVSASALIKATNEPDAATVRDLQGALRACYDEADWLNILQPINDEMRELQRDALVVYILHQMRSNPASAHIDTPEKLFEYFLMDVQMEPCMQTSRVRHALSSVQLFIERCLMNLEPRVAPSSINAKHWEWMSRYRVWEANRKVFLWPENWLEPELRDDQSPFFKETMSELLQSDITEDRAAVALLNYLSKLEELAKLEPCGIHYVENDPGTSDDIAHVVARTAGANRKYYYRRREYGYWTPWEQIKLDVEDTPVIPVVWKGRLFLFWLKILEKGLIDMPTSVSGSLASLESSDLIKTDVPKVSVEAILCYSEYYNGKWQPTKTSDVNKPTKLDEFSSLGQEGVFDRSELRLSVAERQDALRIQIYNQGNSWFQLYNTHSLPVRREEYKTGLIMVHLNASRNFGTSTDTFSITYSKNLPVIAGGWQFQTLTRPVLKNLIDDRAIAPHNRLQHVWDAPFFYEDSRHVFYVTTTERTVTISEWNGYIPSIIYALIDIVIPPLVLEAVEIRAKSYDPIIVAPDFGVVDPSPIERFVSKDAYIKRGIGTLGIVCYGDKEIGPAGGRMKRILNQ